MGSRVERPDPATLAATWGAASGHVLHARVAAPDALRRLLARWARHVAEVADDDLDTEARITWPSRDVTATAAFLDLGLAR